MSPFAELHQPLRDETVVVRHAADRDIPEVLIAHQDDPLMHVALGLRRPPSGAQLGRRVEQTAAGIAAGSELALTITRPDDDECVGQIEVDAAESDQGRAQLRVWVAAQQRRRGLGRAALGLVSRWVLLGCGLERVGLLVAPTNEAMLKAALGAGFRDEGRLRSYLIEGGRRVDVRVLSRVREDVAP